MAKSTIDLSGVDINTLTADNFHKVTGHRLRIPKAIARRVVGTTTYAKIGPGDEDILTRDEARQLALDAVLAAARGETSTEKPVVEASTQPEATSEPVSLFEED